MLKLGSLIFSYVGLRWVSWVLKNYELGLAGLAEFEKVKVGLAGFSGFLIDYI